MRFFVVLLIQALLVSAAPSPTPMQKAQAMVKRMTLEEKVAMLHGSKEGYTGTTPVNARLGIPPIVMNDGPQGFRMREGGSSTSWPAGLTVGATWDKDLARKWGAAMGEEFYAKGANVQLGPGLCVARVPVNGRNFEYIRFVSWLLFTQCLPVAMTPLL